MMEVEQAPAPKAVFFQADVIEVVQKARGTDFVSTTATIQRIWDRDSFLPMTLEIKFKAGAAGLDEWFRIGRKVTLVISDLPPERMPLP